MRWTIGTVGLTLLLGLAVGCTRPIYLMEQDANH